jgi:type II secretory pathway component PulJ
MPIAMMILAAGIVSAKEMKLPQTAAEHMAMSTSYQEKATAWRAEAAYHRDMAAAYRKGHPNLKSGAQNPWTIEMEKHCAALVKDAEKMAGDAEELARFHRLRAMEVEGK